jgi:hypothetical protein
MGPADEVGEAGLNALLMFGRPSGKWWRAVAGGGCPWRASSLGDGRHALSLSAHVDVYTTYITVALWPWFPSVGATCVLGPRLRRSRRCPIPSPVAARARSSPPIAEPRAWKEMDQQVATDFNGTTDLLNRLRAFFREEVRAAVREELGRGAPDTYTSAALPPNTTLRTFRERCSSGRVPGARREGRAWICGRDEWHESRTRRRTPVSRVSTTPSEVTPLAARADALLARAGLRVVAGKL